MLIISHLLWQKSICHIEWSDSLTLFLKDITVVIDCIFMKYFLNFHYVGSSRRDHVRPALKELHWLPVVYRIQFKVALAMFTIHTRHCPDYLGDSVQACNSDPARTCLRSASSSDYTVPRTRTRLGDRAFSVAGPVVCKQSTSSSSWSWQLAFVQTQAQNATVYFVF